MVGVVLPVLIVQVFQYMTVRKNNRQAATDRQDIKAQVCEVAAKVEENTQLTHQNTLSMQAAELMILGAERKGTVQGMEIERRRNTGPAPLG